MPLIRTTFNPAVEINVSAAEHLDLARQGLIYGGAPVAAAPLPIRLRLVADDADPDAYGVQLEAKV